MTVLFCCTEVYSLYCVGRGEVYLQRELSATKKDFKRENTGKLTKIFQVIRVEIVDLPTSVRVVD